MEKLDKCVYCGATPKIIAYPDDGLYYVVCDCTNFRPYEFLGANRRQVIANWNKAQFTISHYNGGKHGIH